jgi:glucosamine kinase
LTETATDGAVRALTAGVDVGGTKAQVLLSTGEQRIVPSAAWIRGGIEGVADGVAELVQSVSGERSEALAVGAHGCNDRTQCAWLERALHERLGPEPAIVALNDAELLLPSVRAAAGVGLIAGTGSVAVGYDDQGDLMIAGGWGGYIGDEGSATGLFRDVARKVAEAYDRGEPEDPVVGLLLDSIGIDHLRELPAALARFGSPTAWAHLAPDLFRRGLAAGSTLTAAALEENAAALAGLVASLRGRGAATDTVVAAGGVIANAAWLQDAVRRALQRCSPASELVVLREPPVIGAAQLADDLAALTAGRTPDHPIGPVLEHRYGRGPSPDRSPPSAPETGAVKP